MEHKPGKMLFRRLETEAKAAEAAEAVDSGGVQSICVCDCEKKDQVTLSLASHFDPDGGFMLFDSR